LIDKNEIAECLKLKDDGHLYHREGQTLEFKESFNFNGLANYFRDFNAFANNKGGNLIFGVTDSPRTLIGLSQAGIKQFDKIDPQRISGFLLEIFSGHIEWEQEIISIDGMDFGIFKIGEAKVKPVIAKKDEGKDQIIKSGEVYFRYGGRTQKIRFAELEAIINSRIKLNNDQWLDLMSKIGSAGPQNAAILDTEKSIIEKGESQIMVVDEDLASKIKFIKEGEFDEKQGASTLKLVGDVVPVNQIDVIKRIKENLIKEYPLSAIELAKEVKKICIDCGMNSVWKIIRENDLKNNTEYAAYNFRNKKQEDQYKLDGTIPSVTPSIFKTAAIDYIINIFKQQGTKKSH